MGKIELTTMNKKIILIILLVVLTGCSFHPYDLPLIGWRLEISDQRKHYRQIDKEKQLEKIREDISDGRNKTDVCVVK